MRQLWSRYAPNFYCEASYSPVTEVSCLVRGKPAIRSQNIVYIDGEGETPVRITRFWFDDDTAEDLVFMLCWDNVVYVLSDW